MVVKSHFVIRSHFVFRLFYRGSVGFKLHDVSGIRSLIPWPLLRYPALLGGGGGYVGLDPASTINF